MGLLRRLRNKRNAADQLRRTLTCAKVIESALANAKTVLRKGKRWRDGDQIDRRVGRGLLVAWRQFRKVSGRRQIPMSLSSMADDVSKQPVAKGVTVAQSMSFEDCLLMTEFRQSPDEAGHDWRGLPLFSHHPPTAGYHQRQSGLLSRSISGERPAQTHDIEV
jgi:hypothetical protein